MPAAVGSPSARTSRPDMFPGRFFWSVRSFCAQPCGSTRCGGHSAVPALGHVEAGCLRADGVFPTVQALERVLPQPIGSHGECFLVPALKMNRWTRPTERRRRVRRARTELGRILSLRAGRSRVLPGATLRLPRRIFAGLLPVQPRPSGNIPLRRTVACVHQILFALAKFQAAEHVNVVENQLPLRKPLCRPGQFSCGIA